MNQKIKVLIVDDEKQFRVTTEKILSRRGFEVVQAGSGEEALEKLGQNPDVIVLDIKMPGMDGLQTLAEIKKRAADLPVIMLTGYGSELTAKTALTEGAYDYLAKPCDVELLAFMIAEAHWRRSTGGLPTEKEVREVMIPLADYTTLPAEATVREAIAELQKSFAAKAAAGQVMKTDRRSLLVVDEKGEVIGILSILDLLEGLLPSYLNFPKPSMADSIQYSTMFWTGLFTSEVLRLAERRIKEIMSPAPLTIEADSNLMEAAYSLVKNQARRMAVVSAGRIVGIIREQDLFFEMERLLRD